MTSLQDNKIIKIIVKRVSILGWSEKSLNLITSDIEKLPETERISFNNVKDIVEYYLVEHNNLLMLQLNKIDISKLKIRQRIRKAIITSILLYPKDITINTAKFLAHPLNSNLALQSLTDMCDQIWIWAGSTDTDFNYYSKRILLGAVYTVSLAYYLKEDNDSHDNLSIFVENRIDNILQLGNMKSKLLDISSFIFKNKKNS